MGHEGAQKRVPSTLPTSATANARRSLLRGGSGNRQIHKTLNNIKITILCGLVTILVLRGTIGFGGLSSDNDLETQAIIEETNRILAEIRSDKDPDDPEDGDQNQATISLNDTYSLGAKISNWDEERSRRDSLWICLMIGRRWDRKGRFVKKQSRF